MIPIIMLPEPFYDLPPSAQTRTRAARGQKLFHQSDRSRGPLFVQEGCVEMIRHSASGHKIVLHRAIAGDTLAEASLFSPRYHCDCVASADSIVIRLDKTQILARLARDPGFAQALLRRLAAQVQGYRRHIELLAIRSARDRVHVALAEIGQQGSVIAFAATLGLTHEATYRALSQLVRMGLAQRIGRGRYCLTPEAGARL